MRTGLTARKRNRLCVFLFIACVFVMFVLLEDYTLEQIGVETLCQRILFFAGTISNFFLLFSQQLVDFPSCAANVLRVSLWLCISLLCIAIRSKFAMEALSDALRCWVKVLAPLYC